MNLNQLVALEQLQSDAMDRLKRGLKPEARERFIRLIEEYQSHYPALKSAQVALHFNLLIASIEQRDGSTLDEIFEGLIIAYENLDRPTSTTLEVSRQLSMWLDRTSLEAFEYLGIKPDRRQVLDRLILRDLAPPLQVRDPHFTLEAHIRPSTISQLSPIDSGVLCFSLARQGSNLVNLPRWMRKLHRLQLSVPSFPEEINEDLINFQSCYAQGLYADAYRALLSAFEWAVYLAPSFAFEWMVGLVQLEAFPEVEHLSYLLSLPLERRVTLAIKIHRDFAILLADERDAERLALHHWQEVIALGRHHLRVIDHRHRELSTHMNEDLETKGWLRVRIAEGLIAQGDDLSALKYLDEVSAKAKSDTYQDRLLAATALSLSGMIYERMGDLKEASERYYIALCRSLPRLVMSYQDVLLLEQWYHQASDQKQRASRLFIGVKRSADLIRLTDHKEALADLDLLQTLLSSLSDFLPYEEFQETAIYLGLTYAFFGEARGARRALEAAQAIDHMSGIALSNLYLIKFEERAAQLDPKQLKRVRQTYERVLKEVEGARGGDVQRQLQLHSAILFLHQWIPEYREMENAQKERFKAQVTSQLRKAHESFCQRTLRGHLCQFSVLLPLMTATELEEVIHTLYRIGLSEASRWLIKILRGEDHPYYFISPKRELAVQVKEVHRQRFEQQWIRGDMVDYDLYQTYDLLSARRDTPAWPQRALNPQEARLEFFVFDEWLMAFLFISGRMVGRRQEISRFDLEDEVFDLLESLTRDEDPSYVINDRCHALYELLIEPFENELEDLHRLIICPDGALTLLPFSALLNRQQHYLGAQLELAIALSTADPVFSSFSSRRGQTQAFYVSDDVAQDQLETLINHQDTGGARVLNCTPLRSEAWGELVNQREEHTRESEKNNAESTIVIFDAEIREAGEIHFFASARRDQSSAEYPVSDMVKALVRLNANSCLFTQNVSPFIVPVKSIKTLLTSVHGGVIHSRWNTAYNEQMITRLMGRLAVGSQLIGLMGALTHLRRTAIEERHSPKVWACFELYIAQHQLE